MTTATGATMARDVLSPAYYLWQAPGKSLSVHVSLEVVDRLEREVIESFKAITKRGSEIGGVLLGRAASGESTVIVEAYEGVPCEYSRGPLYLLADDDKTRLAAILQRTKASPEKGLSVVGFFRSNTRKDLALDEDDLALMSEFFSQPRQVCLLVKPFSMKPSLATFFLWEAGRMEGQVPLLQFPFKRAELLKAEHAKGIVSGDQLPSAAGTAPAVAPPKPEPHLVAAPAAPKREEPALPPAVPPRPELRVMAAPAAPKREEPAPPPA
ncbi:MAG: hypothetical protein FJW34_12140, partial [Acidobacteria bacterium]|nr:hypothetical protein [Acidobacteriota bacterium]